MPTVWAIDPGSEKSALLGYETLTRSVNPIGILPNMELLDRLRLIRQHRKPDDVLVVEDTKAYTLPRKASGAGRFFPEQVRVATFWAGRFVQCWDGQYSLLDRRRVKQLLCGQTTVGDAEVWDSILDRFGGTRKRAVGVKASPGPLFGVRADLRSALAVALAYVDEVSIVHPLKSIGGTVGYDVLAAKWAD
jgi:hypothetical protein